MQPQGEKVCAVEAGDLPETEEYLPWMRKNVISPSDAESSRCTGIYEQGTSFAYLSLFPFPLVSSI